jgi:hypothetical protein
MKTTERPHEAQDQSQGSGLNNVGDVLNQISPYWRTIVGVAVVAVTAIALFQFISVSRRHAEEANWEAYFAAIDGMNAPALQELAQNGSGAVVPWAYHAAAHGRLAEGMQSLYTDRDQARSALEEAVAGFNSAVAASENNDLLNQRSLWGLALANEGLNELEQAKAAYQKLLARWPESPLAKRAQERIASLNSPETQDFYRWFFEQKPVVASGSPFDTNPAETFTIPNEPDLTIPDVNSPADGSDTPGNTGPISTDLEDLVDDPSPADPSSPEEVDTAVEPGTVTPESSPESSPEASPNASPEGSAAEVQEVIETEAADPVEETPDP